MLIDSVIIYLINEIKNRRIEVILTPKLDEISKLLNEI
ncbi:hypothetical protein BN863_32470 [Formosa agariphila KMM 3901]|uniref:Uncharacterized protein n=1 Tax=Formosa agariphila (strain DSM 15362 / KCTC 12365 / LMG 23005 / KMM 3901 / M-2Alg 35-1) TaxID=1347342 RepID=T2KS57_FORAG|nr:hypothetical protein BN863_32470 [Formosa agariphila KMM 3901]